MLSALFVGGVVIWILSNDSSDRPDWYDYPSWLFGMAAMVYAAELLILRLLNRVARISLFTGLGVGILLWLALSQSVGSFGLVKVFSLAAGAFAAAVVDGGYRFLSHPDQGISRFVPATAGAASRPPPCGSSRWPASSPAWH